jgi:nucleoside-diphosphate-sugar epimerase
MRILILGGTGFIGQHVVHSLQGHDTTILSRGFACVHAHSAAQWLKGDRSRLHEHRREIAELQPDVILDMIPKNGPDALAVADVVAGLTSRLVMISSGSVYRGFGGLVRSEPSPINNTPSRENAPLRHRRFPYRRLKPRATKDPLRWLDDYDKIPAEEVVLLHPKLQGNAIRLPMTYGPRDPDQRIVGYLARMLAGRKAIFLRETAAKWRNSRAYVENVGYAIARVVVHGKPGCIYNVSERNNFEEAEWIRQIGFQVNWDGAIHLVSDQSPIGCPHLNELPKDANFAYHLTMDDSLIRSELAYKEVVSLEEGIRRTIDDAKHYCKVVDYSSEDICEIRDM